MADKNTARLCLAIVVITALIARLPALRTWWCLDDWGQLAGAAGLLDGGGPSARWVSQHLYWDLTWPLLGLSALGHGILRIVLHAVAAAALAGIARRCGLSLLAAATAGVLFAAGPMAFTPVYWASGIQELLGGLFALLAVERWLAGGTRGVLLAGVCGVLAIFSKEAAFGLPVLLAAQLLWGGPGVRGDLRAKRAVIAVLVIAVVAEGALVLGHFARGAGDPYAVGGLATIAANLATFGWWLATPMPVFTSRITWLVAAGGGLLWIAWLAWAVLRWRRGSRLSAAALAAAVLSLAPALPLVSQTHPYLGYTAAAAGALTLAGLLPRRARLHPAASLAAAAAACIWGFAGMQMRIGNLHDRRWPADPVVRAVQLSRDAGLTIRRVAAEGAAGIVLLQLPITADQARRSWRDPDSAVADSPRRTALGGDLGPRLLAGPTTSIRWTTSLAGMNRGDRILCEAAKSLQDWGGADTALFHAALFDIGIGHYDRAPMHLRRAAHLGADPDLFICDDAGSGILITARQRYGKFDAWLANEAARDRITPGEADRIRTTVRTLLAD